MDIKDFEGKDLNSFDDEFATREWICDKCGKMASVNDAVIGWRISIDKHHIPRLTVPLGIYHLKCTPHFTRSEGREALPHIDMSQAFDGPNGLSLLLDYAEQLPLLRDGFLKLIRRIFIPRYERLNRYASTALKNGVFEPNDVLTTPLQFEFDEIEKDLERNPDRYK